MFPEPLRRSRRTPIARMASPRVRSLTKAPPAHMLRGGSSADSHGDNGTAPGHTRDLHESAAAPLLSKPYVGVEPSDSTLLCYDCHLRSVYATGESDGTGESGFLAVADSGTKKLHSLHVAAPADGGHEAGAQLRWNPARADPLSQRFDAHPVRVGDQHVPVGDVDPGGIVVVGLGSDDHPAG